VLEDLRKLGYRIVETRSIERTLLGERVERKTLLVEGKNLVMRVSSLGSSRYRVTVVTDEEYREVMENEGMDVAELSDGTIMASASFRSLGEALAKARTIALKLYNR